MTTSQTKRARHEPSGRWRYGLFLSIIATVVWSTVPIALSLLLNNMNAITVTWYRFVACIIVLTAVLSWKRSLPSLKLLLDTKQLILIVVAGICLSANFIIYLHALNFIPPGASQIVMQLAPLFILMGGVFLFHEPFHKVQSVGLVILIIGLSLFFNLRILDFAGPLTDYALGSLLVMTAAAVWATYALAQKQLLRVCSSSGIMLILYSVGVVVTLPLCSLSQIWELDSQQYVVLAYSSANTLIGYGCFAEALEHWEASRVSTIICTTPLLTLALTHPASAVWPQIMPDELNAVGMIGAVLVVIGSMVTALGRSKNTTVPD